MCANASNFGDRGERVIDDTTVGVANQYCTIRDVCWRIPATAQRGTPLPRKGRCRLTLALKALSPPSGVAEGFLVRSDYRV
jgi:hypothetical protein